MEVITGFRLVIWPGSHPAGLTASSHPPGSLQHAKEILEKGHPRLEDLVQSTLSWADKLPTGMCKDFVSGMNEMGKIWISDLLEKGMDPCFPVEKAEEVNHTWIYFVNMVALKGLEL